MINPLANFKNPYDIDGDIAKKILNQDQILGDTSKFLDIPKVEEEQSTQQPFRIPILKKANGEMAVGDFISIMKNLENKYPENERGYKNTITQFRKNYSEYNTNAWNTYLIPDAPKELKFLEPEIEKNKSLELPDGNVIDIGHVFAGLDAYFHNGAVNKFYIPLMRDNFEASTWAGDFGSVLAEISRKCLFPSYVGYDKNESYNNNQLIQQFISEYASPDDLLGDIDTYVIEYFIFKIRFSDSVRLSNIFQLFYLGDYGYHNRRFSIFIDRINCDWIRNYNFNFFVQKGDTFNVDISKLSNENKKEFDNYSDEILYGAGLFLGLTYPSSFDKASVYFDVKNSRIAQNIAKNTMFTFLLELKLLSNNE